jgi:hypothetical protein
VKTDCELSARQFHLHRGVYEWQHYCITPDYLPGWNRDGRLVAEAHRLFVPATTAPALICRPADTPSIVTALAPNAFEKRRRVCRLQRSGCTINRKL